MLKFILRLCRAKRGATAIEYGMILALIGLTALGAIRLFGNANSAKWDAISNAAQNAM